jgi:regulator of nucleoside diphosphate kinase
MNQSANRSIYVTREDLEKLRRLIEARRGLQERDNAYLDALEQELEEARIVESDGIPSDVVTMRSRVRVRDMLSGEEQVLTLVFPSEAEYSVGRLSVLAPIGTALLGYKEGDVIEWRVPRGVRVLRVEEVLYQPEAAARRNAADAVELAAAT